MKTGSNAAWRWIWPHVGATPISQGLDSEVFDRDDYAYSETFVREAIQNSLDARLDPTKPVIMNFAFHEDVTGPRRSFLQPVMEFRKKAGLDEPSEWSNDKIKWLVVEDFNSKGLGGSLKSRTSDFWNYWLNFGISNKDGSGRGGRGIGRVTFLIASRLQSVIGYTRRSSDGLTAICGMTVLRAQEDEDEFLSTHAYLARDETGSIYHLHDSPEFSMQTIDAFRFSGYDGQFRSGLALAVPYPHEELMPDGILAAAIENFAPAIINGALVLNVNAKTLDASSIMSIASEVSGRYNNEAIRADVGRYLHLIQRASKELKPRILDIPNAMKSDIATLRKSALVEVLQRELNTDKDVVLEIKFPLDRYGMQTNVSLRAVLALAPPNFRPLDRLYREGMCLPDVQTSSPGELDLIILVDNELLATYLNFCEGKAHLDLLESKDIRQKLADQGFSGSRVKRLIKALPSELRLLLTPDTPEPDAHVFDTFFSIPSDKPGKKSKPKDSPDPPDPSPPPPKLPAFQVETLEDGFRIRANQKYTDWPINLTMTMAYADGSRHPSWSPFDFILNDLNLRNKDCRLETEKNRIRALDCGENCEIVVTGFDTNRELDTSIRPWKHAKEN